MARGYGGTEPLWAHFGGIDPDETYLVRVHLTGGHIHDQLVQPSMTRGVIGGQTIPQMFTLRESDVRRSAVRIVRWREVAPFE